MRVLRRRNRSESASGFRLGAVMLGAIAGIAVGILLADRGMLAGLRRRPARDRTVRPVRTGQPQPLPASKSTTPAPRGPVDDEAELEARVLETFRNDPILVDRPIDIGAVGTGIIELTGWVDRAEEVRHATTLTRGTIGVHTVINRLLVRGTSPAA